jgi:hypothetical protein
MLSDANGSINSGGMGGIGNLLALATMSEAYLTSGNNIMDDGNGGDAEIGGGPSFTFTEGDIPAMEDDTSSRRPSMTQSTAPPSQYSTFAITHVNEHQINDIPDKEKSGIKPRTDKPLPRRASSLFKKRFKQTTSNKSQQSQKLPESGTFSMKKNQPPFPVILMAILSGSQNWEYITFLSDEQRFIIIDSVSLESKVLPIHFEENVPTYDQFLQLLDLW